MAANTIMPARKNAILTILWLGFVTGTLDAMAAIIWSYVINKKIVTGIIFKFIAYGAFGQAAMNGGNEMVVAGIVFHYVIAFAFTMAFYLLYGYFDKLLRNKYLVGVMYGVIAWMIMNLGVVPLSKIGFHRIKVETALTGLAILIICIGLPIALVADKKYWAAKLSPKK
jgi:MFS-type transporter involved in bile tolerance (Atg22 family)